MNVYFLLRVMYFGCLLATCIVVWRRGQKPERLGAAIVFAGSIATVLAAAVPSLNLDDAQLGILLVDLLMLAGFLALVLNTDRYWPVWVCGFHLVGVATHLVMLFYPSILPQAYRLVHGLWAYPVMFAIMIGTRDPWWWRRTNYEA